MQNIFCFAVPNSQHLLGTDNQFMRMKFLSKLKREGFLSGASDLIVLHKESCYFVEIKSPAEYKVSEKTGKRIIAKPAGKQSDEQIKFQQEVEREGFKYILIDDWKKFEEFLNLLKTKYITADTGYQISTDAGLKTIKTGQVKIEITR